MGYTIKANIENKCGISRFLQLGSTNLSKRYLREHHIVDCVDNAIACGHVLNHKLGHGFQGSCIARTSLELLAFAADSFTVLPISHFDLVTALQLRRADSSLRDDMEEQDVGQQYLVRQNSLQRPSRQGRKGIICRRKDSPKTRAQGATQTGCSHGRAQRRECIVGASDFGLKFVVMSMNRSGRRNTTNRNAELERRHTM